ncbi:hypothetical protein C7S13_2706 [Burkholderia cepacia]|nr:hypothetical protein [Burkholderia cepacia]
MVRHRGRLRVDMGNDDWRSVGNLPEVDSRKETGMTHAAGLRSKRK